MDAADKVAVAEMGLLASSSVSVKGMDENRNIREQRTIVRWALKRM
jgi:hypothetical protein